MRIVIFINYNLYVERPEIVFDAFNRFAGILFGYIKGIRIQESVDIIHHYFFVRIGPLVTVYWAREFFSE
jgi:hypothetical protein